jgi:hypothetical protein
MFKTHKTSKGAAERLLQQTSHGEIQAVDDRVLVAVSGLTKMFLAEVIELARTVASEQRKPDEPAGRIQPRHLREAHRRMQRKGRTPELS